MVFLLRALLEALASTIAPDRCAACQADVPILTAFCLPCARTLETARDGGDPDHLASFVYGGAVAQAIARLKFQGRADLARPLASALQRTARARALEVDLVVPVPLHPTRLTERGYNQSALLARPLAADLGARFSPLALVRTRDTGHQLALDAASRRANVAEAFRVRSPLEVQGRHVLLVDDVRTTGSTLASCSATLASAGARRVTTLVVAVADVARPVDPKAPVTRTRARG